MLVLGSVTSETLAKGRSHDKPVVVERAVRQPLAPVNGYTGTIISSERARLAAEVPGRLLMVAEVGSKVEQGETVARLDDALLQQELIERSADVARIKARLVFNEQELSRLQRLAKKNNAAQSQLEQVFADRASAKSELVAARAREQRTREQLKRTHLRAPFNGLVTERLLHTGEWADEGSVVVSMTDPDSLQIQSWVSVSVLRFVQKQKMLAITLHGQEYQAAIRTLVPVGDMQSRLYELRLDLPPGSWTVGESVRIAVPTAEANEVIAISRDALVLRRGSVSVFRINAEGLAEQVDVTTGIASGSLIEVKGDIQPGDSVVVRGGERLRDGQKVKILNPDPAP